MTNFPKDDYILLTEWEKHYSYPKLSTLRHLVFHAKTNGFDKVVRRIGSRVLIKVSAFFEWVEEQNGFAPTNENKEGTNEKENWFKDGG